MNASCIFWGLTSFKEMNQHMDPFKRNDLFYSCLQVGEISMAQPATWTPSIRKLITPLIKVPPLYVIAYNFMEYSISSKQILISSWKHPEYVATNQHKTGDNDEIIPTISCPDPIIFLFHDLE